jgi:hypothetical protein
MKRMILILIVIIFLLLSNGALGWGNPAEIKDVRWPSGTFGMNDNIITCANVKNNDLDQWTWVYVKYTFSGPNGWKGSIGIASPLPAKGQTSPICQGATPSYFNRGTPPKGSYSVKCELWKGNNEGGKSLGSKSKSNAFKIDY